MACDTFPSCPSCPFSPPSSVGISIGSPPPSDGSSPLGGLSCPARIYNCNGTTTPSIYLPPLLLDIHHQPLTPPAASPSPTISASPPTISFTTGLLSSSYRISSIDIQTSLCASQHAAYAPVHPRSSPTSSLSSHGTIVVPI